MVCRYVFCLTLLLLGILSSPLGAQQPSSCEDQLAEIQSTLAFVRAARQTTEETAGRVTATLQKRLDVSVKEIDKLRHPETPAQASPSGPVPEETAPSASPQKDNTP